MDFSLSMEQSQKLVMTQQLQIAVKLLQLSSIELNEYIEEELQENPVLDYAYREIDIDWKSFVKDRKEMEYFDDEPDYEDSDVPPVNFVTGPETLRDYLLFQLNTASANPEDVRIGRYLIENIDTSGYLKTDLKDAAQELGCDESSIGRVLDIVQSFEPYGVGARDLRECLLIQLRQIGNYDEILKKMVCDHLDEVGENRYDVIGKALSISPGDAQAFGDILKTLQPKPGSGFADGNLTIYVAPDVFVEKVGGRYAVRVNESVVPSLSINPLYSEMLISGEDRETMQFIKSKLDSAAWLIKCIEQRKDTLCNVVSSIVSFQYDFFEYGIGHLKPMKLDDVAGDIGIHESTVSRAVSGKYVQTPEGLYPLKFFFTGGVGEYVSSKSIKSSIREIISGEDKKRPLSDQEIRDALGKRDINISRRTVSKYREELGIPSKIGRKRY